MAQQIQGFEPILYQKGQAKLRTPSFEYWPHRTTFNPRDESLHISSDIVAQNEKLLS